MFYDIYLSILQLKSSHFFLFNGLPLSIMWLQKYISNVIKSFVIFIACSEYFLSKDVARLPYVSA